MGFVTGDVEEVVCSHPTLGTFRFDVKAGEAWTIDTGGLRGTDDSAGVTANGKNIKGLNRVRWYIEGNVTVNIANATEEEALKKLAASADDGTWTISHISGAIRKGTGSPVGDLNIDTNNGQLKLKASGGGELVKI